MCPPQVGLSSSSESEEQHIHYKSRFCCALAQETRDGTLVDTPAASLRVFAHNRLLVLILTLPFTKSEPISFSVKQDFAGLRPRTKMLQGSLRTGAGLESEALV